MICDGYFDLQPSHLVYSYGGHLRLPWPLLLTLLLGYLNGSALIDPNSGTVMSPDGDPGVMGSYGLSDQSSRSYSQLMAGITAGVIVSVGCIVLSVLVQR